MTTTVELRKHREQLLAMILELQANRVILDELVKYYGVFLFTGGVVPREQWGLLAMASYLQCPFAVDCICASEVQHYQKLAEAIMTMGQAIASEARPRTLRCRRDIADTFGRESSEIRALANTLESTVTNALEGLDHGDKCRTPSTFAGCDAVVGTLRPCTTPSNAPPAGESPRETLLLSHESEPRHSPLSSSFLR
jgi:hypothetical protein